MVSDGGTKVIMSRVGFLLASDNADTFSIVCNDGGLYNDVTSVSFKQLDASGIETVKSDNTISLYSNPVNNSFTIMGCLDGTMVVVFSIDGKILNSKSLSNKDNTIQVGNLPTGTYILKAGKTSIKFFKK